METLAGKVFIDIAYGGRFDDKTQVYMALTDKGEVYSWGNGDFRKLNKDNEVDHSNVIDQLRVSYFFSGHETGL